MPRKKTETLEALRRLNWEPNPGPQTSLFRCPAEIVLYGGAKASGKLCSLDTPILTPKGWKTHGDIEFGDSVIDPTTGGPTKVTGVFPQGVVQNYKVLFDDGAWLECGLEHLWAFRLSAHHKPRTKKSKQRQLAYEILGCRPLGNRWDFLRVGSTKEILDLMKRGKKIRVPLTEPVMFDVNGRTGTGNIQPYLIGIYLGDGTHSNLQITSADEQIHDYIQSQGYVPSIGPRSKMGRSISPDGSFRCWIPTATIRQRLRAWLINHGLNSARAWEKFLPSYILTAPLHYRLEILRGLMDSDGYVDQWGHCSYTTTSKRLAEDVIALVRSLGGKTYLREKHPHYSYKGERLSGRLAHEVAVWIPKTQELFKLERKRKRCRNSWNGGFENMRGIVSIEPTEPKESVCLRVNSPYGLYVAKDYIVTHNSDAIIMMMLKDWMIDGYKSLIIRRNYTELERHIIPRTRQLLRDIGKYNEKTHRWTLKAPNYGESTLEFGYVETPDDVESYSGTQFSRIGLDESTQFPERVVRAFYGLLRSPIKSVQKQLILTCNPIGPGFLWHKKMFVESREPFQVYKNSVWPSDGKLVGASVCFIPARVWDNPVLLKNDPGYPDRLRSQYGPITEALLEGSWERGLYLAFDWDDLLHVELPPDIPPSATRWIAIDWGVGTSKAACLWFAEFGGRIHLYRELIKPGREIIPYATEVAGLSAGEKIDYCVLSHECFARRGYEPGNAQSDLFDRVFGQHGIRLVRSDRDPKGRLMLIREYLRSEPANRLELGQDYNYWLERIKLEGEFALREMTSLSELSHSSMLPKLKVSSACTKLIHDMPLLVVDRERGDVLASGQETDAADALGYGLRAHILQPGLSADDLLPAVLGWQAPQTLSQWQAAREKAERMASSENSSDSPVSWPSQRIPVERE